MNLNTYNQHFLINKEIINKLVNEVKKNTKVIEIGPGTGNITKELIRKTNDLTVIEKDKDLYEVLIKKYPKVNVINKDVLKFYFPNGSTVVGNIPFNITEPLIEKLIKSNVAYCVFIVGENFVKSFNTNNKLSLLVRCFFETEIIADVDKKSFWPQPRTNAKLIKLTPSYPKEKELKVMREFFFQRDKKAKNALVEALVRVLDVTRNEARSRFSIKIPEKRIENLNNKEISNIYEMVKEIVYG